MLYRCTALRFRGLCSPNSVTCFLLVARNLIFSIRLNLFACFLVHARVAVSDYSIPSLSLRYRFPTVLLHALSTDYREMQE